MKVTYDFHMHSCLSPCAADDMTPGNITAMAGIAGLRAIALTDHNSCGNARVFCERAAAAGLIGVPGMELTTREEIHILCLFPDCAAAEAFGAYVYTRMPDIPNRRDVYGYQYLIGSDDEPTAFEPRLLANATDIPIGETAGLAEEYGGVAFPAHIERAAFSLLSVLGAWDGGLGFTLFERAPIADFSNPPRTVPASVPFVVNSDAHWLGAIADAERTLDILSPTAQGVVNALRSL